MRSYSKWKYNKTSIDISIRDQFFMSIRIVYENYLNGWSNPEAHIKTIHPVMLLTSAERITSAQKTPTQHTLKVNIQSNPGHHSNPNHLFRKLSSYFFIHHLVANFTLFYTMRNEAPLQLNSKHKHVIS